MNGLMSPRAKYVPSLAAAVTPIMKLLVVVDALSGARVRRSMAITLNRPLSIPSNPDVSPAPHITARPCGIRVTWYSTVCPNAGSKYVPCNRRDEESWRKHGKAPGQSRAQLDQAGVSFPCLVLASDPDRAVEGQAGRHGPDETGQSREGSGTAPLTLAG